MIEWDPDISRPELLSMLNQEGTVWLDATDVDSERAAYVFAHPIETVTATSLQEVDRALHELDQWLGAGYYIAGCVSYEAGYALEKSSFEPLLNGPYSTELGYPLIWFGVYNEPIQVHGFEWPSTTESVQLDPLEPESDFIQSVQKIRNLIAEGDVYQVNHTTRFVGEWNRSGVELFGSLRSRQPVRYGAYLRIPGAEVLSFSPELFFRVKKGHIETRPMKGTAPRGSTPALDEELKTWLAQDVKNRAENLMIVDLLRNDLSMICEPGSVVVPHRFDIETHPTVHQMTSTVQGKLGATLGLKDIFGALFPCGSITGAPKIRAMKRISELETTARGVYCGAIGFASPGQRSEREVPGVSEIDRKAPLSEAVFSVAIRTATIGRQVTDPFGLDSGRDSAQDPSGRGNVTYGAGGGIVWDSDPHAEYVEAKLKTRFLSELNQASFYLFETMLWDGSIQWLQLHLDRLEHSARHLGIRMNRSEIEVLVLAHIKGIQNRAQTQLLAPNSTSYRVRLTLNSSGAVGLDYQPYVPPSAPVRIGPATMRVSSSYPLLRHKSSDRLLYQQAQSEAQSESLFDVFLKNERDEVTEGSITNLFIRKEGRWFTPPLSSGLLPGVGRRVFLLESGAEEHPIGIRDIENADELRVTNALIGSLEAIWVSPPKSS